MPYRLLSFKRYGERHSHISDGKDPIYFYNVKNKIAGMTASLFIFIILLTTRCPWPDLYINTKQDRKGIPCPIFVCGNPHSGDTDARLRAAQSYPTARSYPPDYSAFSGSGYSSPKVSTVTLFITCL